MRCPTVKAFVLDILSVLTCFEGFMSVPEVTVYDIELKS